MTTLSIVRPLGTALSLTLPLLLAACGGAGTPPTVTPSVPAAQSATLGGVRVIDTRTYQLGVSALDGANGIVRTGTLSAPTVSQLSAGQATVSVCGQIQAQDVLTTAISLDSTGSMVDTDPQELRQKAAQAFVDRMSSSDRAAVLSFDSSTLPNAGLNVSHLWQPFTNDRALLTAGIANATFAGGGTPLYNAALDANTLLGQTTGGNKNVLLLTDGANNQGTATPADVIAAAKKSGTRVFAVGLDRSGFLDFSDLETIASQTGGLFQKATDAAQLKDYFDHMYNAVSAQGCLQLNFTALPVAGTTVTGTVSFTVSNSGRADAKLSLPFTFTAR